MLHRALSCVAPTLCSFARVMYFAWASPVIHIEYSTLNSCAGRQKRDAVPPKLRAESMKSKNILECVCVVTVCVYESVQSFTLKQRKRRVRPVRQQLSRCYGRVGGTENRRTVLASSRVRRSQPHQATHHSTGKAAALCGPSNEADWRMSADASSHGSPSIGAGWGTERLTTRTEGPRKAAGFPVL